MKFSKAFAELLCSEDMNAPSQGFRPERRFMSAPAWWLSPMTLATQLQLPVNSHIYNFKLHNG
jgi:hypothetical protein